MNLICRFFIICLLFFMSSCSPFGNSSLIESLVQPITSFFNTTTKAEVVSGGSQNLETNPGTPSLNYKVSVSVGDPMTQTATLTNDGYQVQMSIQGSEIQ